MPLLKQVSLYQDRQMQTRGDGNPNPVPVGTDCPGTGNWPGSTWRYNPSSPATDDYYPLTGGELQWERDWYVSQGDYYSSSTVRALSDNTFGQSGGVLYQCDSCNTYPTQRYVLAIESNGSSVENRFRRWTSGLSSWVETYTEFPDDT